MASNESKGPRVSRQHEPRQTSRRSTSELMTLPEVANDSPSAEVAAYQQILRRIRLGDLGPGARIRTEDIAVSLGLSRQPVREAIRRLEAEGYVTARPNRGAAVTKYTPVQLQELFEIRAALESLAVSIALPRLAPRDFVRLEQLMSAMTEAGSVVNNWLARHGEFHLHLANAAPACNTRALHAPLVRACRDTVQLP
jgi:DNA-binding GntR family transcriptional regulator